MTIKAIETIYKGYRFRSRLEARWAVFFDSLGIKWEYEAEGYVLSDGTRYLPDFELLDVNGPYGPWVEVKGEKPTGAEVEKLALLCEETCMYGLLVWGDPLEGNWLSFHKEGHTDDGSNCDISTGYGLSRKLGLCDLDDSPLYLAACKSARSARFEHGESGARK